MVAHGHFSQLLELGATRGGSLPAGSTERDPSQPGLHSETLSQIKKKNLHWELFVVSVNVGRLSLGSNVSLTL